MTMDLKLSNLATGVKNNAESIGIGLAMLDPNAGGINSIVSSIQNAIAGQIHLPDPIHLQWWAQQLAPKAIMAYIGGSLLNGVNLPVVGSIGGPLKKGATGYLTATFLMQLAYALTHSENKGLNIEDRYGSHEAGSTSPQIQGY